MTDEEKRELENFENFVDYFNCGIEAENLRVHDFFVKHNLMGLLDEDQKEELFCINFGVK